ncbi:MAG: hypothetical protein ACSHWY_07970 [Octadecabacter sp.]
MKITTVIAAAALAVASTAATAENVTTSTGDVVMIEKNMAPLGLSALQLAALGFLSVAVAVSASSGT